MGRTPRVGRSGVVTAITVLIVAGAARFALAQPMIDPTRTEFSPSPDHSTTSPNGTPIVQHYLLELYISGATAPFQTVPLGKPAPDPDGIIRVDLRSVFSGWPVSGTLYVADIAAVGPGGVSRSGPSNTFSFSGPCSFTVSPTSHSAPAGGGSHSVSVSAGAGCGWTAASNATWITLTAGSTGTANGSVSYTVAANPSTTARTGTLTAAGRTVTVTQSGATCSFTVSPTSHSAAAGGGSHSVSVSAGSGCGWTAASNATWITLTAGSTGTANGSVSYTVAANASTTARTGTLTVAGGTVTVTQNGTTCSFTVSPTSQSAPAKGGTYSVSVSGGSGCGWTAASNVTWITVTAGSNGTGAGSVNYTVVDNRSSATSATTTRTGTLTVAGRSIAVTQKESHPPNPPKGVHAK